MKILINLMVLLLLAAPAGAFELVGSGDAPAAPGVSCTGGLVFSADFESSVNADCVDGTIFNDLTGAINGNAVLVTGADGYVSMPGASDFVEFDIAAFDDEASILLKLETTTYASATRFISLVSADLSNYIECTWAFSSVPKLRWASSVANEKALTAGAIAAGGTYYFTLRWRTGATNPSLSISAYNASTGALIETQTITNDLTPMVQSITKLAVGNNLTATGISKIYSVKIYDTFDGAPTSGF